MRCKAIDKQLCSNMNCWDVARTHMRKKVAREDAAAKEAAEEAAREQEAERKKLETKKDTKDKKIVDQLFKKKHF